MFGCIQGVGSILEAINSLSLYQICILCLKDFSFTIYTRSNCLDLLLLDPSFMISCLHFYYHVCDHHRWQYFVAAPSAILHICLFLRSKLNELWCQCYSVTREFTKPRWQRQPERFFIQYENLQ